ncbi:PadR family transcriptional regulator [bacterium]|nr:MAG: PadR family transcriptional regulator [bacterium]
MLISIAVALPFKEPCIETRYIGFRTRREEELAEDRGLQKSNATTLVLVVLRDGARHGYDIAREVERRSDNVLSFNHGTLYPVLHALEQNELIQSTWEQPEGERRRRVYCLTEAGTAEADREIARWRSFSDAMEKVIGGSGLGQTA